MFGRKSPPMSHSLERAEMPLVWFRRHVGYRNFILTAVYLCCAVSFWSSFELRYDFEVPDGTVLDQLFMTPIIALLKTCLFVLMGGHSTNWRYTSLRDMERLLGFNVVSTLSLLAIHYLYDLPLMGRGVILIDFFLCTILVSSLFMSLRIYRERVLKFFRSNGSAPSKKVIIVGSGDAGEMIVREILRSPTARMTVSAFFDDNQSKHGRTIHGIPVVGGLESVPAYVKEQAIESAIVAIPSASREQMRRIHDRLRALDITIKTLPPLAEIVRGSSTLSQLREINIADLLGRKEIRIDSDQITEMIQGKVVLVTGAGGSIGTELCRQTLRSRPAALLLMERSENSLFHLHRQLAQQNGSTEVVPLLCDITHEQRVFEAFATHRPTLVFHAAAHKHVPLQELDASECFRNNVGGTRSVARASISHGVELFLMISTDKAVNPTSVMGATKRACEILCQAFASENLTKFVSVRFGNVLGSDGSVVPIFLEQISRGGPITVTHPDMRRYFMTIPEAVSLVLQAAAIGESGQILVLDMGEPIKIVDLARQLLQLVGKDEAEVPIEFVGLRPGEKLFEELQCDSEACLTTAHESIWVLKQNGNRRGVKDIEVIERALRYLSERTDLFTAQDLLVKIVPEYARVGQESEKSNKDRMSVAMNGSAAVTMTPSDLVPRIGDGPSLNSTGESSVDISERK